MRGRLPSTVNRQLVAPKLTGLLAVSEGGPSAVYRLPATGYPLPAPVDRRRFHASGRQSTVYSPQSTVYGPPLLVRSRRSPAPAGALRAIASACRLALVAVLMFSGSVHAQMPDLSQMSGVPLPSPDLPDGTVSVRVVRGTLGNNQSGVRVSLEGAGVQMTADTDADGRAIFTGLRAGTSVRARVTAGRDAATTEAVDVPASGGIRFIVALGLGGDASTASAPPAAAVAGRVVFGSQTRTIVEVVDEALEVFHVFEVANIAEGPVDPGAPVEIHLPADARSVTLLEGSTSQARVFERRVVIAGPFAPGRTMAQVAYRLPYEGARRTIDVQLPLPMMQTNLIVRQLGDVTVVRPTLPQSREAEAEGRRYLTATGPGLNEAGTLIIELDGLPHHSRWPVHTALVLALVVVAAGVWLGFVAPVDPEPHLRSLDARRLRLLDELRRLGAIQADDPGTAATRAALLGELEGVYALIDAERERLTPADVPAARRAS